jgi:hypothetical protein
VPDRCGWHHEREWLTPGTTVSAVERERESEGCMGPADKWTGTRVGPVASTP